MQPASTGREGSAAEGQWPPSVRCQLRDGLYRATFRTPLGEACCDVWIRDGFLGGSDPRLQLRGSIRLSEARDATAIVGLRLPNRAPGSRSIFGHADQLVVVMSGARSEQGLSLSGALPGVPDAQVLAQLEFMKPAVG